MGKGNQLAILGIIFGIIGMGMGGYAIISPIFTPNDQIEGSNYYCVEQGFQDIWGEWSPIENLFLIISVSSGEKVFVSYNGKLTMGMAYTKFQLAVNDTRELASEAHIYTGASSTTIQVSIQYVLDDLSMGTYNISVYANSSLGSTYVTNNRLFAFTYT